MIVTFIFLELVGFTLKLQMQNVKPSEAHLPGCNITDLIFG